MFDQGLSIAWGNKKAAIPGMAANLSIACRSGPVRH